MVYGPAIIEPVSEHSDFITRMKKLILATKTKYQEVQIVELAELGRALVLDGFIQSTEVDEHIYHETLVHPALLTHPSPERVLIIGGGEGATLREVLRHPTVKEAVMVDIDGELVEFAKKYLDFMHQGAFDDPRAKVVIADGKEYVARAESGYFDAVVIDLIDPYAGELARELYSDAFYAEIKRIMKPDGIMVTQAGNSFFYPKVYTWVLNNVKAVFPIVREYWNWVPSFGYACNFIIGSLKHDPLTLSIDAIKDAFKARGLKTRYITPEAVHALLRLPVVVGSSKN